MLRALPSGAPANAPSCPPAPSRAAARDDENPDDPLGIGLLHESDGEYDTVRDNDAGALPPEPPPMQHDMRAKLAPAPFHVMLTCYTLFERDRCAARPGQGREDERKAAGGCLPARPRPPSRDTRLPLS